MSPVRNETLIRKPGIPWTSIPAIYRISDAIAHKIFNKSGIVSTGNRNDFLQVLYAMLTEVSVFYTLLITNRKKENFTITPIR